MRAAVLVFLAAAILAAALVLGLLQFGSSPQPPPAIALHGFNDRSAVLARQPNRHETARTEVRQRVEQTMLSADPAPRTKRARR
jgi:hypothetical protein